MSTEPQLSKNALKKAEKAAKKAAAKKKGGEDTKQSTGQSETTTTTPPALPRFCLIHPCMTPACIKTVWSSMLHGIKLTVQSSDDTPKKTMLTYGDVHIGGGGGNAMALAFSTSYNPVVDEWCEWERTVLRKKKLSADDDDDDLPTIDSLYLVGGKCTTIADVCVVTTLQQLGVTSPYVSMHQAEYDAAVTRLQEYIDQLAGPSLETLLEEPRLLHVVTSLMEHAILQTFPGITLPTNNFVKESQQTKNGDYQCSIAMAIFAQVQGECSNPPQVAQRIIDTIGNDHDVLCDLQTIGPGFILLRLRASFLEHHINQWLPTGRLPIAPYPSQTCVVDFSSPNIAKEMHVGHLRSTIIGESVCRILECVGNRVYRVNHVGDWGTQFGMLIQYLREEYPEVATTTSTNSNNNTAELPNITDLTQFYKQAKTKFDADADFKQQSQQNVVALQAGDPQCRAIWQMLCDVSRKEFEKVYQRLDVTVHECGESFYNDKIPSVVDEFSAAGKLQVEDGGAKCWFGEGFAIPLMLQKSDGGYGYDSTDMAALKYRLQELKADRIIVITDFSQGSHFDMCFAAGRDIGWLRNQKLQHIGFGTVMGEDGKRFKTRSGDTVRLVDLLDEAVTRMEEALRERIAAGRAVIDESEVHAVAEAVGYGAVKYFDLHRNPTSNYKFSYDKMLATNGDTAVYLLYARARLQSIITKAEAEYSINVEELLKNKEPIVLGHAKERNLAWHLQKYADAMDVTLEDLFPCHICEYAYKLAIAASDFVTQCKVLGSPEMKSRVLLSYATTLAMTQAFDLLGIRDVKRI